HGGFAVGSALLQQLARPQTPVGAENACPEIGFRRSSRQSACHLGNVGSYYGPLPPPAMMAQYNETLPGLADRIMKLAEQEQGIRRRDNGWILSNDTLRVVGSILVSLGLIAAGVYCGVIGEPWLGGVLGTSGAVAGVASKLLSR
ncbi:MAG: DUF2335 domain-containing protein, partial [Rhodobacter sp.]|nr:DUF2335 domain-containing protein [Rhodobacter sp.]